MENLYKQNIYFKIISILLEVLLLTIVPYRHFFFLAAIFIMYFSIFAPKILLYWVKTLLKITLLFIAIILPGLFWQGYFTKQLLLVSRIIFMVLLSVYFVKTTTIKNFIIDSQGLLKRSWGRKLVYFLVSLSLFMKNINQKIYRLRQNYKRINLDKVFDIFSLDNETLENTELIINQKIRITGKRQFFSYPNLSLLFLDTITILVLST